ncbi:FAD-dependent monooxygenase [Streptomyces purpurascens]
MGSGQYVVGCDGPAWPARRSRPQRPGSLKDPFGWLGILADRPPSHLLACLRPPHDRGFALPPPRPSPASTSRLLTDPAPRRGATRRSGRAGAPLRDRQRPASSERGPSPRSPSPDALQPPPRAHGAMGRLFLAGDAAHIVPPTGAGLNLAVGDVVTFARLTHRRETGSADADRGFADLPAPDLAGRAVLLRHGTTRPPCPRRKL